MGEPSTMLYAAPRSGHHFIEICPRRAYVREVGNDHGRCPRKFACIVPGDLWQGDVPKVEYAKRRAKLEADYQHKMEKFNKRVASPRTSMFEKQLAGEDGSREGSKASVFATSARASVLALQAQVAAQK